MGSLRRLTDAEVARLWGLAVGIESVLELQTGGERGAHAGVHRSRGEGVASASPEQFSVFTKPCRKETCVFLTLILVGLWSGESNGGCFRAGRFQAASVRWLVPGGTGADRPPSGGDRSYVSEGDVCDRCSLRGIFGEERGIFARAAAARTIDGVEGEERVRLETSPSDT